MTQKEDFRSWFERISKTEGHLVTPIMAAQMLEVHKQYIDKLNTLGRIKKHYYDNQPYIGMNDINKELIRRWIKSSNRMVFRPAVPTGTPGEKAGGL